MTTPPDFGGESIEQGVAEDLGLRHEHGRTGPPAGEEDRSFDDNEAHAPGSACARCGQQIAAGADARQRADGQWVHEECPPAARAAQPG